jgi:hypothetical protein
MTALVLDTGALVAVDRGERRIAAKLRVAQQSGIDMRTTGVVIAEVWRDEHRRQASLVRLLKSIDVRPVDQRLGQDAGTLLGRAQAKDPADATVVAVASTGDRILTSDPRDIRRLVAASRRAIHVVAC